MLVLPSISILSISTTTSTTAATRTTTTSATPIAPTAVTNLQWAVQDSKALFIQGGSTSFTSTAATSVANFYSLDLTKPWIDTQPSWASLPPGPATANQTLLVSIYNNTVILWDTILGTTRYDLLLGTWGTRTPVPYSVNPSPGTQPVLQPGTDMIFSMTGFIDTSTMALFAMLGYNFRTQLATQIPMGQAPLSIPLHYFYAAVWSKARNSMLVYGGVLAMTTGTGDPVNYFLEYFPDNSAWADLQLVTKDAGGKVGEAVGPGPRHGHCMVEAYQGTKIVVFGGYTGPARNVSTGAIHVLDVATLTWTQGKTANATFERGSMACACSGDSFVAWGGDNNGQVVSNTPIIYNMRTNQWVHQFDPDVGTSSTFAQDPVPTPSPTSSSSGTGSSNHAGIIGGTVAAVVVILAITGLVFQRYRRRRRHQQTSQTLPIEKQPQPEPEIVDRIDLQKDEKESPLSNLPDSPVTPPLAMYLAMPSSPALIEDESEVVGAKHKSLALSPQNGNQGHPEEWKSLEEREESKSQDPIKEADNDKDSVKDEEEDIDVSPAHYQNPFSNSPQYVEPATLLSSSGKGDTTIEIEPPLVHSLERGGLRGSFRNPQWPSDGKRPSSVTFPDLDPLVSDPHAMIDQDSTRHENGGEEGTDQSSEVDTVVEDDPAAVVVLDRRDTVRSPQWRAAGDYRTSVTFRPPTPPLHSPQIHRREIGMEQEQKLEEDRLRIRVENEGVAVSEESSFLAFELLMERSRLERELQNIQEKLWRHHIPASTMPKKS